MDASYDTKQRVKQAIDIVDLLGSYLSLRREGRNYKALCPWHDDTRPSLQVNAERQSWKCWVCDVGGDIFSFVMKIEGIEFPQALSMLAERAGIPLTAPGRGATTGALDEKRVWFQAMQWVFDQYHQHLLHSEQAAPARRYLADRQISPQSIQQFQLGSAPDDWSWILEQARNTPYTPAMLERIGVISRRQRGSGFYDRFRSRVLFPIFDAQNRAVGLGGRISPNSNAQDAAKYVNSPETPLFTKSKLLYGLNVAREAIRKSHTVLVTEGYTDCIMAHQFGFANTVAVLGTALGDLHLRHLRQIDERIRVVLVLDGDEAGRRRASEVLQLFVAGNVNLRVLTLPDQLDPAEFLLERGADAFARLVDGAVDALEHAFHTATSGIDLQADLHAATQALEQLTATIALAPRLRADTQVEDRLREEKFLQRLAADFRVPESQVRGLMTQLRRKAATRPAAVVQNSSGAASNAKKPDPWERELLEILLHFPSLIENVWGRVEPAQLASPGCRAVFARCGDLWSRGILPDCERLLLEFDDVVVKNLLVELDESGRDKAGAEALVRLEDVVAGFAQRQQKQRLQGHTAALKTRQLAEEEELALLADLERDLRARQQQQEERARLGSSDPTDG